MVSLVVKAYLAVVGVLFRPRSANVSKSLFLVPAYVFVAICEIMPVASLSMAPTVLSFTVGVLNIYFARAIP